MRGYAPPPCEHGYTGDERDSCACPACELLLENSDLLAENQRLRDALERVKRNAESWHGTDPDRIDLAHHGQQKALNVIAGWCREALAGDAE